MNQEGLYLSCWCVCKDQCYVDCGKNQCQHRREVPESGNFSPVAQKQKSCKNSESQRTTVVKLRTGHNACFIRAPLIFLFVCLFRKKSNLIHLKKLVTLVTGYYSQCALITFLPVLNRIILVHLCTLGSTSYTNACWLF